MNEENTIKGAALVTGGAVRIGKSIAIKLAALGYDIALHYNGSETEAVETKDRIEKYGVRCRTVKADFSNEDGFMRLADIAFDSFPDLNVLVNSASVFIRGHITDTGTSLFDTIMNINFKAPFFLSKKFGTLCKNGNIVNILDVKITEHNSNYAAYNLSKKALYELTLMSAKEFAPSIRVNGVAPGLILPPPGQNDGYLDRIAEKIPMKKKGSIENITGAVEFILKNDYITGQVIFCDGGQHLI